RRAVAHARGARRPERGRSARGRDATRAAAALARGPRPGDLGRAPAGDRAAHSRGHVDARTAAARAGARAGARAPPGRDGGGAAVARRRAVLVPSRGLARDRTGAARARARLRRGGDCDRRARLRLLRPSGRDRAGRDARCARRRHRRDHGRALHARAAGARAARESRPGAGPLAQRGAAGAGRAAPDLRPGRGGAVRVRVVAGREFFVWVSANLLACAALAQAPAIRLTTFYETWPGDNVAPPVRTVVAISYDAHALYVGIWAQDPDPSRVRAAYADRDNVGSGDDYVALVLDTRGDGRVGTIFRVSPRAVQADGVFNEAQFALGNNPDDLTPDFAWEARTAIGDSAWTAELRIPFTSLRYPGRSGGRQRWGVIVHRVYPRELTHSLFSVRMPRGTTCFLCHAQRVELTGLPTGGALLAAPYATAQADRAGAAPGPNALRAGADLKWTPGAGTALDATLRPDFSQIEADVPQLSVNSQFALFYPEKRPFFLEGSDLFQTPLQVVYTRSIAAPEWGARATGEVGRTAYTVLVTRDAGGGSAIVPGPTQSTLVTRDFASTVGLARLRTAFPRGFAGLLATDRE